MSKLLYVEHVLKFFRSMADEPDTEYLPNSEVAYYLSLGYERFRDVATEENDQVFTTRDLVSVGGSDYVDLSSTHFETTINGKRMKTLVAVYVPVASDVNDISYEVELGPNEESIRNSASELCYLDGTILRFGFKTYDSIVISYIPEATVDWTQYTSGDNEYIDRFVPFHDLIALYALDYFKAKDERSMPEASGLTMMRQREWLQYLRRLTSSHKQTIDVTTYRRD